MNSHRLLVTLFATGWFGLTLAAPALTPLEPTLAAPLKLNDLQGKEVTLQDYRGKVVLINFWATYCKPCREEMPSLATTMNGTRFVVCAVWGALSS